MNIRQKYELKMLSDDGRMDMEKVAELFSINLRTVRYDIQILNEYLREETGTECIGVRNKVAYVDDKLQKKLVHITEISGRDFYTDRLTGEERMLLILFDLCWSSEFNTIQNLADKYFVSRATVNKDISAVKAYCRNNHIRFQSSRGKGLYIEADEIERRQYMAKIIRDLTALKSKDEEHKESAYSQWFEEKDLDRIKEILMEVEEHFSTFLSDVAYEALAVHIALSIERFRTNGYGNLSWQMEPKQDSIQYQMALEIVRRINEVFQIQLPDAEIHYVALHIGAKSSAAIREENSGDVTLEYYCIRMISAVGRQAGYDLTGDDRLYESLLQHINVCVYRKKSGMLLENPIKEELINSYPQLYEIIGRVLKEELDSDIIVESEDEIAYILLHFATAIYRRQQNANRLADVAVVCATGSGTAELVTAGLRRSLRLSIVGTVAEHRLEHFLKKQECDLIISTVPIKGRSHVRVSPLLRRDDIVRISKKLLDLGFDIEKPVWNSAEVSETAVQLEYLLQNYAGREQEDMLIDKLRILAQNRKTEKGEQRYMLSELLNEESIRLDITCTDWKDSVKKSGEVLIRKGDITEDYVQAVIDNVTEAGPYIVIAKGVALPHATNKVGVLHTSMCFVRLAEPVNFGNKSNDPVKYIFMLATIDSDSHLGALQDLAEFLDREEFMSVLDKAETPSDVIEYIKSNESSMQ